VVIILPLVRFAWANLASRPVRSLLALLGLTVAIMGMVCLFSIAAGLQSTVNKTFGRIPGVVGMQPGAPIPLFSRLPAAWADEIEQLPGVRTVCREVWTRAHLVEGKVTFTPPRFLFGVDVPHVLRLNTCVYRDDIVEGRYLTPEDAGSQRCVVSRQIAAEYGKKLGDELNVDGYPLTIVGIYDCGSLLLDVAILVDAATARTMGRIEPSLISSLYIEPTGEQPTEALCETLRATFRGRAVGPWEAESALNLPAAGGQKLIADLALSMMRPTAPATPKDSESESTAADGLEVRSAVEWGQRIQEFSSDMDLFLGLMNMIGVVIALLSILNTMLMSVTERLTEFGVLRANGWTSRDVLKLILYESALLGIAGGLLGCFLGVLGTWVVNWYFPTKLHLYASPPLLAFSLLFSTLLGMFGGLYPAWFAVRITPMEAIRRG
jgi:putative ABC transport system permease protein